MTHWVAARAARKQAPLVGRADELESLERLLDELERGPPAAIELLGEPGNRQDAAALRARLSRRTPRTPRSLWVGVGARTRAALLSLRARTSRRGSITSTRAAWGSSARDRRGRAGGLQRDHVIAAEPTREGGQLSRPCRDASTPLLATALVEHAHLAEGRCTSIPMNRILSSSLLA